MPRILGLLTLFTFLIPLSTFAKGQKVIQVVTSTGVLADFVKQIGAGDVEVASLCGPKQNPHDYCGTSDQMERLQAADFLIVIGSSYESSWLSPLLARMSLPPYRPNPKIAVGSGGFFETSNLVSLLDAPSKEEDSNLANNHPQGNPHFLLNPNNAVWLVREITVRMGRIYPEKKEAFRNRSENYISDLERKIANWKKALPANPKTSFVGYHATWAYLAGWLPVEMIGTFEARPGIPPTESQAMNLLRKTQKAKVRVVITSSLDPQEAIQVFASEAKAHIYEIPEDLDRQKNLKNYIELMDFISLRLNAAHLN